MSTLQNKIDFVALVSVKMANGNGDPLNGNRPRTDNEDYGEISDVCIKRKIRNRMQDLGHAIFVQSEDRSDDGFHSLSERASVTLKGIKDRDELAQKACEKWLDGAMPTRRNEKRGAGCGHLLRHGLRENRTRAAVSREQRSL